MVALAPCFLVIIYLLSMAKNKRLVAVPVIYFIALSLGLFYYLLPAFINYENYPALKTSLMLADLFMPAFSFLLIFQLLLNRVPPVLYWLVLAIPAIAIGPLAYKITDETQVCLTIDLCMPSENILYLNNVVISSFIFMLLVLIVARRSPEMIGSEIIKKNKYWLIISLIIYSILRLMLDLGFVSETLEFESYVLTRTIIKMAFIYMVITSIFRVFTDLFDMHHVNVSFRKTNLSKYEQELARKVERMMDENKIYREMGFNRAKLADMLGIGEHLLSRIINIEFKKSFSDLSNDYRIKEARELLATTETPVTTISFDVGFNSIASFNRVFKSLTGKSPSQYRDDMKKEII